MLTISDLPALNATLNGIAAILLVTGYLFIKRGRQRQHQWCMLGALTTSGCTPLHPVRRYRVRTTKVAFESPAL